MDPISQEDRMNAENEWKKFLEDGGNPIEKKPQPPEHGRPKRQVSIRQQRAVRNNSK